jgi:hypothetical protein
LAKAFPVIAFLVSDAEGELREVAIAAHPTIKATMPILCGEVPSASVR